jgi:hypothetical protein
MGVLYLIGDNLPRDTCPNPNVCMSVSVIFSTISLMMNIVIPRVRKSGVWSEGWSKLPTVGSQQEHWIKLFVMLSEVVLLNQILTSAFEQLPTITSLFGSTSTSAFEQLPSVPSLLGNSSTCGTGIHVGDSIILVIGVVGWAIYVIYTGYRTFQNTTERKFGSGKSHGCAGYCSCCGLEFILIVYVSLYMFGDLDWPWECFESDRGWKIARAVILGIACCICLFLAWIYIIIAVIPSLHAVKKGDFFLQGRSIENLFGYYFRSFDGEVKLGEVLVNGDASDKVRFDAAMESQLDTLSNPMTFKSEESWTEEWEGCLKKLCCCGSQTVQDAVGNGERDGKRARGTGANAFNIASLVYATKSTEATLVLFVLDKKASIEDQEKLKKMFPDAKIQAHSFEEKIKLVYIYRNNSD